jgi:hypothetical protein
MKAFRANAEIVLARSRPTAIRFAAALANQRAFVGQSVGWRTFPQPARVESPPDDSRPAACLGARRVDSHRLRPEPYPGSLAWT